ncbi:hypothetical protein M406DRAFT_75533 [Cryphonectria parasitica EP155]|uniref:Uncharacterized protein n=1 Tax=Cryphonectria parasitica (strain ATCC 38755 / EP155) TaxID=660469 RepID=A0A9P5CR55_CRYP1|nr:uncharacterized protein M406DRAFT_75533 [Cryphonectria parasitica EP155]KAF3768199.1 hypothetical protein M406DRAFT_75533 [Cryphonectria parasitica EP155]
MAEQVSAKSTTYNPSRALTDLPAALEWVLDNGTRHRLIHSAARPLKFSAIPDTSGKTSLFELRFTIELRQGEVSRARTPIYLWIQLDRIRSATLASDNISDQIQNILGNSPKRLHLMLARPADLVGPPFVPRAAKNAEGAILDSILLLPGSLSLTLYLQSSSVLVQLCRTISSQKIQLLNTTMRLGALYCGNGGRVITGLPSAHPSPPSYDKLKDPSPPLLNKASSSHSNKRRRVSSPGSTETMRLETARQMIIEQQKSFADTLHQELAKAEARILERVNTLFRDQSEKCDELTAEVDRLDDQIRWASEELDCQLDDRMVAVKCELESWVKDEIGDAADIIKQEITQASISIEFNE